MTQVRFALESVFEGVHGAGELGGVAGDGSGAAIRIADQVRSRLLSAVASGGSPRFGCPCA